MTTEEYANVVATTRDYYRTYASWRFGQSAFNALYDLHPEIANEVRGTENDPFYNDKVMPDFWAWLGEKVVAG